MNCGTCKFFEKAEPGHIYGSCHRMPPTPDFSFSIKPGRYGEGGEGSISRRANPIYPNTHETDDWCGEHQPRKYLEAEIVDEDYHVFPGSCLTVCCLTLKNGFTVTGESARASPENFDAELGRKISRSNAREKIWPLLGFRLKDAIHQTNPYIHKGDIK